MQKEPTPVSTVHERSFNAMGTQAHLIVVANDAGPSGAALLDQAEARIEDLEARWSRFRPTSELCRLNAAAGRPAMVSKETYDIVRRAVDAWYLTAGRFDPTVLAALEALGYDRTFTELAAGGTANDAGDFARPTRTPGCGNIALADSVRAVTLPVGVALDLGGIGKGYGADLVATELRQHGAAGACVSLGGDMRCVGEAPWAEGWRVSIEDPFDADNELLEVVMTDGAVVTSTRLQRTWSHRGRAMHHIVDPRSGRPATTGLAAVTVVAGDAWWAEVLAKAAFLAGPTEGAELLALSGVTGLLVDDDGNVHRVAQLEVFAR
jgi:thiamine biosynthesis lipoprotein